MYLMKKLAALALVAGLAAPAFAATDAAPWWQQESAMDDNMTLRLDAKPWWEKAKALKTGEQFVIQSELPGGGAMLVRRLGGPEMSKFAPGVTDVIQLIIDDDGDMDAANPQIDTDSDCIISDFKADGIVDEMTDYIDNNGDNLADEMERRSYPEGQLRYAWVSFDLDGNGKMWDYDQDFRMYRAGRVGVDFFRGDHHTGDGIIFINKIDPNRKTWIPFSECPFRWYDTDKDGFAEVVLRFSALPMEFASEGGNADAANSYAIIGGPWDDMMNNMGILNVRYSIDIDNQSSAELPLHFDMGFNLLGGQRYDFRGMEHTNGLRREPKTLIIAPHEKIRDIGDHYRADQTGFNYMEHEDASINIGDPADKGELDRRWEGVFWNWERRIMHNTGGPNQMWNMRREYKPTPSERREVYYSPVDRRLHLKGATEGWTRVGMVGSQDPIGEIRTFDTDGDGYVDKWQYFRTGEMLPYRTDMVSGIKNRDLGDNYDKMTEVLTGEGIPEALRQNEAFSNAVGAVAAIAKPVPDNLVQALAAAPTPGEKRYVSDIIREWNYLSLRDATFSKAQKAVEAPSMVVGPRYEDTPQGRVLRRDLLDSETGWQLVVLSNRLDTLYGRGEYEEAAKLVPEMAALAARLP